MAIEQFKGYSVFGILIFVVLLIAVTSAQITFSRQWVRGKYPGDSEGGESPEFQRMAKSVYPLRDAKRSFSRFVRPDYVPILVNAHMLEEILEKMKESPISAGQVTLDNAKK